MKLFEWRERRGDLWLFVDNEWTGFLLQLQNKQYTATKDGKLVRGSKNYLRRWRHINVAKGAIEALAGKRIRKTDATHYVRPGSEDNRPLCSRVVTAYELRKLGGWVP